MTDESSDAEIPVADELAALLADPAVWDEPAPGVEDATVAAIAAEAGAVDRGSPGAPLRSRRRLLTPAVVAAAVVLLAIGVAVVFGDDEAGPEFAVTLEATDLAPDAGGEVAVDTTPLGTRLVLSVAGLPPAPEGKYYEAWLRTGPERGVSAGTFHLRGGDGEIELWAGVGVEDYPLFTITVQDEGDPVSSGRVVLKGRIR